jgi:hypothetical protein
VSLPLAPPGIRQGFTGVVTGKGERTREYADGGSPADHLNCGPVASFAAEPPEPREPSFQQAYGVVASIIFTFEKGRPYVIEAELVISGHLDRFCPVSGVRCYQHAPFGKDCADQ